MDLEREQRLLELLNAVCELPAEERRPRLESLCDDPALIDEVLTALADEDDSFLSSPVTPGISARIEEIGRNTEPSEADILAAQPRKVGAFTLVRLLGEGGMGRVFLATQSEPVERQVALKLLKWTFSTPEDEARFDAERQALARLSHPNIVQLYEAGTTPDGRPWFAMELDEGEPISDFCNRHQLTIEQRLKVFQDVCAAVEHAHRRQILHRDIKPSNVLVTLSDNAPLVKMIDFGVAKGLDTPLTDTTLLIDARTLGTPAYASPESLERDEEIDTRADVYSLGVLLYQLVCGVRPIDDEGLTLGDFIRRIIEVDAPRPGVRFQGLAAELRDSIAEARGVRPAQLQRLLGGDLGWIALKAIARKPAARYGSASELSQDVQRFLEKRPTLARPPTAAYLARRYLRRHAWPVAAAALVIAALSLGLLARTFEARRAQAALAESEQLSGFLVDLFRTADPDKGGGARMSVRDLLDEGARRIQEADHLSPASRAELLSTLADTYAELGQNDPAVTLAESSLAVREAQYPANHPEVIAALSRLGDIYRQAGRRDEAYQVLDSARSRIQTAAVPDAAALALVQNHLGNLYYAEGNASEAESSHRQALALRRNLVTANEGMELAIAESLNNLGAVLVSQRRYAEARPPLREAGELFEAHLGEDHPRLGAVLTNLAMVEARIGQFDEMEQMHRRAIAVWSSAYGEAHPRTLSAHQNMATDLRFAGRHDAARVEYAWVNEALTRQPDVSTAVRGRWLYFAARNELDAGQLASARALLDSALSFLRLSLPDDDMRVLDARDQLGRLQAMEGDLAASELTLRASWSERRRRLGDDHPLNAGVMQLLAMTLASQGDLASAHDLQAQAWRIRQDRLGPDHPDTADAVHELARITWLQGDLADAEPLAEAALAGRETSLSASHPLTLESWQMLNAIRDGKEAPPL